MKTETIFQVQHRTGKVRWTNSVWDGCSPRYFPTRQAAEDEIGKLQTRWRGLVAPQFRVKEIEALGGLPIPRRRGAR
jgi:hypothetical protein